MRNIPELTPQQTGAVLRSAMHDHFNPSVVRLNNPWKDAELNEHNAILYTDVMEYYMVRFVTDGFRDLLGISWTDFINLPLPEVLMLMKHMSVKAEDEAKSKTNNE